MRHKKLFTHNLSDSIHKFFMPTLKYLQQILKRFLIFCLMSGGVIKRVNHYVELCFFLVARGRVKNKTLGKDSSINVE